MALMNLVDRVLERRSLENPADWMLGMFGARSAASGVLVSESTAMRHGAVYACVRVIAETIGSLPLHVYKRDAEGSTEKATDHPLYPILHDQPNPEQTAMEFREMMQGHLTLRHNAYAEIVREGSGRVRELWPMHPGRVRVARERDALAYYYRPTNLPEVRLPADRVLHLRGLSEDGVVGLNPVLLAEETIGTALAQEEFDARFFSNGATPPAVIEYPQNLGKDKQKELRESLYDQVGGLSRAHRFLLLQGGLKWTNVGMTLRDAQFIEGRKLSIRAIARLFRMQPHKIGDLEQATFSNIEHQGIEHVVDTILPWAVRWDQKCTMRLLTERERRAGYYVQLNLDGLLRGDMAARAAAHQVEFQNGALTINEWRAMENRNRIKDDIGDKHFVMTNVAPADAPRALPSAQQKALPSATEDDDVIDAENDERSKRVYRHLLDEATGRIVRREGEALRRVASKSASDADEWRTEVTAFYARHAAYIAESLGVPLVRAQDYANDHRARVLAEGLSALDEWESEARAHLAALASERGRGPA